MTRNLTFNLHRVRSLNNHKYIRGLVAYWMSRDQRVEDNWALIYAQSKAIDYQVPLLVIFCLTDFPEATTHHYHFMLNNLKLVSKDLRELNINFVLVKGKPEIEIPKVLEKYNIGHLIVDYSPLRTGSRWRLNVAGKINIPFDEADAHNIVPVWMTSQKQEYAARTIRSKILIKLPEYLTEFPKLIRHPYTTTVFSRDINISEFPDIINSGEKFALSLLSNFIVNKLDKYDQNRNDPNIDGQSNISPYLHFGQISAQRVALEIFKTKPSESREVFLEELIIRRELADNFCFYNKDYDSVMGFPDWAQKTLSNHENDKRDYLYTREIFEQALTHDNLWNAAQNQMIKTGKMHGYMRMYWAKKILEWTINPQEALKIAVLLNDKYSLDGRDPNGYTGIAWSIGGVHDRPWFKRSVFGAIRYMSYQGLSNKFNVHKYISKWRE